MDTIIAPAYVGFYQVPLSWFCEEPSDTMLNNAPFEEILKIVHEGQLYGGIRYKVRRDGLILFDCNKWELGTFTEIPGYEININERTTVPTATTKAEKLAEKRAYNRSMLINAYQICLNSSHTHVRNMGTGVGHPVLPEHLISLTDFSNPISLIYSNNNEPYCFFVDNAISAIASRNIKATKRRRLIEQDVVEYSFILLDQVLRKEEEGALQVSELLYLAHHHYSECSFTNSLMMSWVACEKLINDLWRSHILAQKQKIDSLERMSKKRREKLQGRDFNVSIVTETLELLGIISIQMLHDLDEVRKNRNGWLHELKEIDDRAASQALFTTRNLISVSMGIAIDATISRTMPGTGGVPVNMYSLPD